MAILTIEGLGNKLLMKENACCIDWLEEVLHLLDKKAIANFFTNLWTSWNNQNNLIFRGKEDNARLVWEKAKSFSNEFHIHNLVNNPLILTALTYQLWKKPPRGFIKVNFDAAVAQNRTGYGVVMGDEDSFVIGGSGGFKDADLTRERAEIYAFEESVKLARTMNFSKGVFETDYASLANRANKRDLDITIMGMQIKENFNSMDNFNFVSIS
ncbi:hypothetical protein CXB51_031516 [Gossypium anomalum]|uniref:RNase H type-1 domain-containing protein n=1 Tax=Gossypium anomalum TaxID=47600 RepID=A0A8J5YCL4_9ROSI|nr:hypothetical protein CXB51_031516 [Gossypium anomalum]